MKRIRLIFLILLFLSVSLIINGQKKSGDTAIPKDIAIELLKPAWESMSRPADSPMIFYLLKMKELSWQTVRELEYKLAWGDKVEEEGSQLIVDQELISSVWPGVLLELKNSGNESFIKNEYNSCLVTIPAKEGTISINNILIGDKSRESPAYFRFSLTPIDISLSDESIYTYLKLEYKDKPGNMASVETSAWFNSTETEPVALLKLYQEGDKENQHRYFALFIEARTLYPELLKETASILVMNDIKGINQIFSLEKENEPENQFAIYAGSNGGGIEFNRSYGGEKIKLSLFSIDGTPGYQLLFDKNFSVSDELFASVQVQKKTEPHFMLGLKDNINYTSDFKWQLSFYPLVIALDVNRRLQPVTEILLSYEGEVFAISYQGIHHNEEISNIIKINYEFTPVIGLSVIWKKEACYLGLLYNK